AGQGTGRACSRQNRRTRCGSAVPRSCAPMISTIAEASDMRPSCFATSPPPTRRRRASEHLPKSAPRDGRGRRDAMETDDTSTSNFDPRNHKLVAEQRWFDDFRVGERFPLPSRTMTEAIFLAFQAASGDNHPIHYDIEFCRARGMPNLLAHGYLV